MKAIQAWPGFGLAFALAVASATPVSVFAAGSPLRLAGELSGMVTDATGRPQAGALVVLLNKQEQFLQRITTDSGGAFSFSDLLPDLYSVRVTMGAFLPAARDRLQVRRACAACWRLVFHAFSAPFKWCLLCRRRAG